MRAAVVHAPGAAPDVSDRPDPVPAPGRTVVRVTAAPVVPLDLMCASGTSYFGRPAVPYVPGVQGVGVVERSGSLAAGTRVWFSTSAGMAPGDGSLAELCAADDVELVPLDSDVPDPLVAALGLSAVAAWMALSWRAGLRPGERVLILGAGGAVGQSAIGAARAMGAGRIVAVARSAEAQERARRCGADRVVAMTSDVDELVSRLTDATEGAGVDVVLDPVFGAAATAASHVVADGGRLVNLGGASADEAVLASSVLRSRSVSLLGYTNNSLTPEQRRGALTAVVRHAGAGLISVAHETRPLEDVTRTWRQLEAGAVASRIVVCPAPGMAAVRNE